MTNCERMETDLIAYLDAKANPATRHKVEAHLAECVDCRQRAAEFRALWGVLDDLPAVEPSAAFDARVRTRIAAEPPLRNWSRAWWRTLAPSPRMAFAAAALVALSVWMVTIRQVRPSLTAPLDGADGTAVTVMAASLPQANEAEFRMIENLPELENYDLLSNFDALSDLAVQAPAAPVQAQ